MVTNSKINAQLSAMLADIIEKFDKISQGSGLEVTMDYPGDFRALKDSIEATVTALNLTMQAINSAAEQVSTGAAQVSSGRRPWPRARLNRPPRWKSDRIHREIANRQRWPWKMFGAHPSSLKNPARG